MAKYPDIVTTNKGRDLISQANSSNKAVKFTKVMVGAGELGSTDIQQMTSLLSPKMTLPLTSGEDLKNGHARLNFALSNSSLTSGFYAKEIGVFAQVESGPEVLFAYTNGGNYVDYIPDKSTPIASQVIEVEIVVGNAQNVQIVLSDDTYITVKELEDHNADVDAHQNFKGATAGRAGTRGMVPAPAKGDQNKFLCADGTFRVAKMTPLELVNILYPVGTVLTLVNDANPNALYPGTTWRKMDAGRILVSAGTYTENDATYTYALGDKGGEAKHQLTTKELPAHGHAAAASTTSQYFDFSSRGMRSNTGSAVLESGANTSFRYSGNFTNTAVEPSTGASWQRNTIGFTMTLSPTISVDNTGNNQKHENRPPYEVVNRWVRMT